MKNCNWKRARNEDQKAQRVTEIVSATERLYEKFGYQSITFVDIAKEAGFTRSNLYKYFCSKEEIFLEFFKYDFKDWKSSLLKNYKDQEYQIDEFVEVWIDTFMMNKRLLELTSILYLHLEKEASYDSLLAFKSIFVEDFMEVVSHLSGKVNGLTEQKTMEFLIMSVVIGIGLYQMTDLSENQKKILELPDYSHWKIDFREKFVQAVKYILDGLLNN